ncbi:glycosyltransferase family 2 protein [Frigoribacterium sp. PvP032]|uniref:glycosyltransferase family 2 protein n=1 Tax=Frigoribacterium sp. PvP032 TaxID=2806589 RepID=UPI001AE3157A|nr:glycosyltransferase family 2 protein [Frigoribacterium sp. PvP032]MBP1190244.1 GT2 family glycosyltransferase [Frigoribacterium sp. PvP032]
MTVVVPVYDDMTGLEKCVRSLLETVDVTVDRVLLSNDVGPQVDAIEDMLLSLIEGREGFEYHRNAVNLGFVGNCNQAVLELDKTGNDVLLLNSDTVTTTGFIDEMAEVLYSSSQHGVVAPRSNNATIASMPLERRVVSGQRPFPRTQAVHDSVAPLLPRFTVAPVAMGFCYLVRRELIDLYGFFDETFAPGYGEENDFCLRVNEHGWQSVLANRALVFHAGSTSFGSDVGPALRFAHEKLLIERYPFYVGALALWAAVDRDPVDLFADTFLPSDDLVRVAVDLRMPSARRELTGLTDLVGELHRRSGIEVTVLASRRQREAIASTVPGVRVVDEGSLTTIFDAVVLPSPLTDLRRVVRACTVAPRLIVQAHPAPDSRWSVRVASGKGDAGFRGLSLLADAHVDLRGEGAADAVREAAGRPIDIERLRARWQQVADAAIALGTTVIPRRASRQRRLALLLAANHPRLSNTLRARLRR